MFNQDKFKDAIRKFKNVDLTQVKDTELRAKGEKLKAKQKGFTLLELLVVVAILAVIAGATISSISGKEERSAQKTAVHTMAAMENSMRVFSVEEKRVMPEGLDSLVCTDGVQTDYSLSIANIDTGSASAAIISTSGAQVSNLAGVNGGLTADLHGKLDVIELSGEIVEELHDNGLQNLRYANGILCNTTGSEVLFTAANTDATSDIDEPEDGLVEIVKPSLIFQNPVLEDDEWEFGAGAQLDLSGYEGDTNTETIPMALFNEPAELGMEEEDILLVFGVSAGTELGSVIARAPQDGNAPADKYSNYSIVVKVAECPDDAEWGDASCDTMAELEEVAEELEVVAILDAGGDGYDDEVAEAKGNEEE